MNNKFLKVWLLSLVCLTILCNCQQPKQQHAKSQTVAAFNQPTWIIGNYVDEFGEPTGANYVYQNATGSFSNSATDNSQLNAVVQPFTGVNIYGDTLGNVSIQLFEYGKRMAKGKGAMYISVKGNDGTVVKSLCYNNDRGETIIHSLNNDYEADSIFNLLMAGGKVMFSLESSKAPYSRYKFTVQNADGLLDALIKAKYPVKH